ncbi:MAG: 50S ribosomal protein L9 [Patescibacteria group bacterium]
MKVIFLQNVPKAGKRHDIKEVNDGYAINFLLPKKLVKIATNSFISEFKKNQEKSLKETEERQKKLIENLEKIRGEGVVIKSKTNELGHLFSGIHKKEILEALKKQFQIEIKEENIILEKIIKEVGEFEIPILLDDKKYLKKYFFKLKIIN